MNLQTGVSLIAACLFVCVTNMLLLVDFSGRFSNQEIRDTRTKDSSLRFSTRHVCNLIFSNETPVFNARHSVRHLGETCAAYEDEYTAAYLVCRNSGGRARVIRGDANALVTLVAQSSIDRLDRVERMLVSWPGPVSLALYVEDTEQTCHTLSVFLKHLSQKRTNVAVHVVLRRKTLYPANYLRNVAISEVVTDFVFLQDADLILPTSAHLQLNSYARTVTYNRSSRREVYVVPVFETNASATLDRIPQNKEDLLKLLQDKSIVPFRAGQAAHSPTRYRLWKHAIKAYKVVWADHYEPYILMERALMPSYDNEFFLNYDKISFTARLALSGFSFYVLPNVFSIHLGHVQTTHSDTTYDWCSNFIYKVIKQQLIGKDFAS